jgi:protein SCO1
MTNPIRIIAACALLAVWPASAPAQERWGADYFPNVALTTQDGKVVRFYDDLIKGKTVAIDLIYTTCQYACPLETARLAQVQRVLGDRVGRDIFFYSITIDPAHDTPEVLKAYAEKYRVGPGWLFLTGSAADIESISRKLGLYTAPADAGPDGHTPNLLVGNQATGQWMRNSALDDPRFLARTIGDWLDSWQSGASRPLQSFAEVPALTFDRGEYTFRNHCAACHTIGGGDGIGPDLKGVAASRERQWLERFIASPDALVSSNDPIARALLDKYNGVRMPNLGLAPEDADVLIGYIAQRSDQRAPERPASASSAAIVSSAPSGPAPRPADVSALVESYLRIQTALAEDRFDGVLDGALAIANLTAKIGSRAAAVKVGVNPFAQAADLRAARDAFGPLSDAVIAFVRGAGGGIGDGINTAYCPMARKWWLQRGKTVSNPYFGKAMAECGEIRN